MNKFSDEELARMRSTQVGAMQDTCIIKDYSTTNDHGEEVPIWTERSGYTDCGLNVKASKEIHKEDQTIVTTDAELRLPLQTMIDQRDHILMITRFGQSDQGELKEYAIAGEVRRGPSGLLVDLVIVDPGVNR